MTVDVVVVLVLLLVWAGLRGAAHYTGSELGPLFPRPPRGLLAVGSIRSPLMIVLALALCAATLGWVDVLRKHGLHATFEQAIGGATFFERSRCHDIQAKRHPAIARCPFGGRYLPGEWGVGCTLHGSAFDPEARARPR